MKRKIIEIEEEKCNGCGACAEACHESAIVMIDGKAKLMADDYCDGLGDCLPTCPVDAIHFVEREAVPYDAQAVEKMKAENEKPLPCGCPGTMAKEIRREEPIGNMEKAEEPRKAVSHLAQWPVQIKLVSVNSHYFQGAKLLVAADCTAYAYASFHEDFIKGHITLVGCPKLDSVDYSEKLTEIIKDNDIRSVTVVRMEVPCCGGIETAVKSALKLSEKMIPWHVVTISTDGKILDEN